jgi:CheY-like chemotaxis protein
VGLAQDVAGAAERVREGGYRVILLDMRLPDGDGAQVLREARRAGSGADVVVVTGHHADLEEELNRALCEGARAVLDKPLDVPALLGLLRRLTAGPGRGD